MKNFIKISNYPPIASYRAIQFFDHTLPQICNEHESMSNPNAYSYSSQSLGEDSIDEILKIFFNFYPTLIKDFLSHH